MRRGKRNNNRKKLIGICLLFILVFAFCTLCFGGVSASAGEEARTAYYKTVTVEPGDSLWSLARDYAPAYSDLQEYVEQLKSINRIRQGDLIRSGQQLIIVYYQ